MYIPFTWLAGGLALLLVIIGVVSGQRSRQRAQEDAAKLNETLVTRGWQHHLTEKGNVKTWHFSGTTDGVPWTVESVYIRSGDAGSAHDSWTRWHTTAGSLPGGLIEVWPTKGRKFPEGTVFKP